MEIDEYRKLAAVEDDMWYFRALHAHVHRELAGVLGPRAAILDAGCGTAGLIRRLAAVQTGWRWTGVDLSPQALELARQRTSADVALREASVTALPFADGEFDAVVSADVLYHVDDDRAALREYFRVVRPGGVVVLNVPAYRWLWSYHDEAVHSRRRYERAELLEKMTTAGFAGLYATYWNTLPFPLVVARRKLLPPPKGGSDVQSYAAPVERVFRFLMACERGWLANIGRLPFGSSVLAAGRKPGENEL
jgi:ubiquinone/menaquinone biosynthesis C-methylase UbiE